MAAPPPPHDLLFEVDRLSLVYDGSRDQPPAAILKDVHDLRHDAASTLTMAGVPQRTVMALLGHRDPRMTVRYQHLSPGHLRDAVRALDQRATPAQAGTASSGG